MPRRKLHKLLQQSSVAQYPTAKDQFFVFVFYLALALITQSVFKTITVWPAAGVALAAVLIFGARIWPSIAVATFVSVLAYFAELGQSPISTPQLLINLMTVIGNTLAALAALRISGRVKSMGESFANFSWLTRKFFSAVILFGFVSAVFGVGAYWLIGQPWNVGFVPALASWAISNIVGAIVIAPVLMTLRLEGVTLRRARELRPHVLATLLLLILMWTIFGPGQTFIPPVFHQPSFVLFPLLFVALTRGQTFTYFFLALTFFSVWLGTSHGYGPFLDSHEEMINASMQAFIGSSVVVILLVQALFLEQRRLFSEQRRMRECWTENLENTNRQLEQKVAERTRELSAANRKLEALSNTDGLTQLANRRRFDKVLEAEIFRLRRSGAPLSLIMLDVDFFKKFNDTHGHVAGDECLRQVGALIKSLVNRPTDLSARYGGEEFAVILPETNSEGALAIAERLRRGIAGLAIPHAASSVAKHVTASLGVVTVIPNIALSATELVKLADTQLYQAKQNGRNRIAAQ